MPNHKKLAELNMRMARINFIAKGMIALLVIIFFVCTNSISAEKSLLSPLQDDELGSLIKKRITEWRAPSKKIVSGERIYSAVLVESFYKGRQYQPAWSRNGQLIQAETLISAVDEAYGDGLSPDYYHLNLIQSLVDKVGRESVPDSIKLSDLDILLTDAFLTLGFICLPGA